MPKIMEIIEKETKGKSYHSFEVIFGDSSSSLTELEKHRLLSKRANNC